MPRTFQGRLTLGFISVVSLTLLLVGPAVILRLDAYFLDQEQENLNARAASSLAILGLFAQQLQGPVLGADGQLTAAGRGILQLAHDALRRGRRRPGGPRDQRRSRSSGASTEPRRSQPAANGQFRVPSIAAPKRLQSRESLDGDVGHGTRSERPDPVGAPGVAVEPVHLPRLDADRRHRPVHRRRDHRLHRLGRRRDVPRPPVHHAAPAADDGRPRPRAGRARQPRPDPPGGHRRDRDLRAVAPVQRDGRPARGERRDHPPRPRPEPRLPGRRVARAADPDRGPADVERAAQRDGRRRPATRGPSSSRRAASSSSGSTGWPRTCSSSRSSTRGSSCSTCGRTTSGPPWSRPSSRPSRPRRAAASTLRPEPARRTRSGSATTRSGSARSSRTWSATPSSSRRAAARSRSSSEPHRDGARIDVRDTRRRDRRRRAAPHLRALLPRVAGQRGARQRQRARPGDREVDRRHARRAGSTVESRLGAGTTFTVLLPRDPRAIERAAAGARARTPETHRRRLDGAVRPEVADSSPSAASCLNPEPPRLTTFHRTSRPWELTPHDRTTHRAVSGSGRPVGPQAGRPGDARRDRSRPADARDPRPDDRVRPDARADTGTEPGSRAAGGTGDSARGARSVGRPGHADRRPPRSRRSPSSSIATGSAGRRRRSPRPSHGSSRRPPPRPPSPRR